MGKNHYEVSPADGAFTARSRIPSLILAAIGGYLAIRIRIRILARGIK